MNQPRVRLHDVSVGVGQTDSDALLRAVERAVEQAVAQAGPDGVPSRTAVRALVARAVGESRPR